MQITARQKHHLKLQIAYTPDELEGLSDRLLLKWYEHGHPHGWREGVFYSDIVPAMAESPVARHYDVVEEGQFGQTHILLEDLSKTHFNVKPHHMDRLTPAVFTGVLDAYVNFHARWWDRPTTRDADLLRPCGLGVSHEALGAEHIHANARFFASEAMPRWIDAHGEQSPRAWRRTWERAIEAWAELFRERTEGKRALTLIHGDAHMDNVLVPRQDGRTVIVDWEGLTLGLLGVWDVSRLLLCFPMTAAERRDLERILLPRYQRQVEEEGIVGYDLAMCHSDYRLCILANIPHVLVWGDPAYMEATMTAYGDWECDELL